MKEYVYTGSLISDLVALIEKRACVVLDCSHIGQPCVSCGLHFCNAHSEECMDCRQSYCEECATFHGMYCEKRKGEVAGDGSDPVHDHRRDAVSEVER